MADFAILKNQIFAFCRRPELFRLVLRNVTPADDALLQSKVERCVFVDREIHPGFNFRAEADGPDLHPVLSSRQFFYTVVSLAIGQYDDSDLGLRVLSLDERTLKRRSIHTFHCSREGCALRD